MKRQHLTKALCVVLCLCTLLPCMAAPTFAEKSNLPAIVAERPAVLKVDPSPIAEPKAPQIEEKIWEFDFASMNGQLVDTYSTPGFGNVKLSLANFELKNNGMGLIDGKKNGTVRVNEPQTVNVTSTPAVGEVGNSSIARYDGGALKLRLVVNFDALPTVTASAPNENILSFITWEHKFYKAGAETTTTEYARFLCLDENGYLYNNKRVLQSETHKLVAGKDETIEILLEPASSTCKYHLYLNGEYVFSSNVPISKGVSGIASSCFRFFDTRRQYNAVLKSICLERVEAEYSVDDVGYIETSDWFGYQTTAVSKGEDGKETFDLRIVSLLNTMDGYVEFGHETTAAYRKDGASVVENAKVRRNFRIYTQLNQTVGGKNVLWSAEDHEKAYISTATVKGIDASLVGYELRVRPYAKRADGVKIYGKSQYLSYDGIGADGRPHFNCSDTSANELTYAVEDTYVRFGSHENTDFFDATDLQYKWNAAGEDVSAAMNANGRFTFLKFDLMQVKRGWANYFLILNYSSAQSTYGTDIYEVDESVLEKGSLKGLTGAKVKADPDRYLSTEGGPVFSFEKTGSVRLDITDYVNRAFDEGKDILVFRVEYNRQKVIDSKTTNYAYADMYSTENGTRGPAIMGSGYFTYETNLDTYENAGYEPWGYAEKVVDDWYNNIWKLYARDYGYSIMNGTEDSDSKAYEASDYALKLDVESGSAFKSIDARTADTIKGYTAVKDKPQYDGYGGNAADGGKYYNDPAYSAKVNGTKGYFGTYYDDVNNRWWFITPEGNRYLALGICTVNLGSTTAQQAMAKTTYNGRDGAEWTSDLLNSIGLNTSTGSSISEAKIPEGNYVISTHAGVGLISTYGSQLGVNASVGGSTVFANNNTLNVFDPDFVEYAYNKALSGTASKKDSPYMLGWTSDNEIPANTDMLIRYLTLDPTVDDTVKDDLSTRDNEEEIEKLNSRNAYSYAVAWTWLRMMTGKSNPTIEDARAGVESVDMGGVTKDVSYLDLFRGFVYYRYYSIAADAVKTAAPNQLYLGCRELSGNYQCETVMRVAGAFCDAVTLNLYLGANPPAVTIDNIHKWSGKPAYVTEFYAKSAGVNDADTKSGTQAYSIWEVVYPALNKATATTYYTVDQIKTTVNGSKATDTYYADGKALWTVEYAASGAKAGTRDVKISAYMASGATNISAYFIADGKTTYRDASGAEKTVPEIILTNNRGAGKTVRSQDDRGVYYETFALKMLESGFCVGWSWYRYQDNDMPLFRDKSGNLVYFNDWAKYEDWDIDPNLTLIHKGENTDQSNLDANKGIVNNAMEEYTEFTSHISNIANNLYTLADHFDERRN